jgi:chromosome segregation ATPase
MEDLQDKLNKLKRQNEELKSKIDNQDTKNENNDIIKKLNDEIILLKNKLETKHSEFDHIEGPLEQVVEELQNKLNKAKTRINILQDQLKGNQNIGIPTSTPINKNNISDDGKLKMQRDLASFLQQQLDDAKRALKTKVEEIGTIKNEAIRIKRRYEDLEAQIQFKDNSIRELRNELDTLKIKTQLNTGKLQQEDPSYELRIQELKSMLEDLKKQNIQQRLEINQYRKNI